MPKSNGGGTLWVHLVLLGFLNYVVGTWGSLRGSTMKFNTIVFTSGVVNFNALLNGPTSYKSMVLITQLSKHNHHMGVRKSWPWKNVGFIVDPLTSKDLTIAWNNFCCLRSLWKGKLIIVDHEWLTQIKWWPNNFNHLPMTGIFRLHKTISWQPK